MKSSVEQYSGVVLTAAILFYAGIAASAWFLFRLSGNLSADALVIAYGVVGITFFAGVVTVTLLARSRKHTIVYLEKKQERTESNGQQSGTDSQLNNQVINNLLESKADGQQILNEICNQLQAGQAALYTQDGQTLTLKFGYALPAENKAAYQVGEGLIGRVAAEGKTLYIDKLPENYATVFSGLGVTSPTYLSVTPVKQGSNAAGVIEIATFSPLSYQTLVDLERIGEKLATLI